MRIALKPDGQEISIEQYKALSVSKRPAPLVCPGKDAEGTICLHDVWTGALASKKRSPYFAAHHIPECDEGAAPVEKKDGNSGHDHPVTVTGVVRITLDTSDSSSSGTRSTPNPDVAGTTTRRFKPVGPGQGGHSQDAAPHLRTVLRQLLTSGFDPDTIIECPRTKQHHRAEDYFLPLAAGGGSTGWRMFYGQIARTWLVRKSGSLGIATELHGAPPTKELVAYIPQGFQGGLVGEISSEELIGHWIIVLAEAAPTRPWVALADLTHAALLKAPATPV